MESIVVMGYLGQKRSANSHSKITTIIMPPSTVLIDKICQESLITTVFDLIKAYLANEVLLPPIINIQQGNVPTIFCTAGFSQYHQWCEIWTAFNNKRHFRKLSDLHLLAFCAFSWSVPSFYFMVKVCSSHWPTIRYFGLWHFLSPNCFFPSLNIWIYWSLKCVRVASCFSCHS